MNSIEADDHLIATAHAAFGGHISKGLLKRASAAVNRRCDRAMKTLRAEIFERIGKLPPLWRGSPGTWEEVAEIVYKCVVAADLGDNLSFDYRTANRSQYCHERVDALRHFVTRYAGK